ncbi:hypothetical protein DL93DRAFT_2077382 [Clavulina sp. PMI_390]|nr:hypothetical protein DL93DRAFT_2077382 [Clavulina sp. PMI_390]
MAIVNQAENVSLAGDHQGPYPYPRPTIQTSRFSPDGSSFSPTSTTPTLTSPTSSRRQNHQDLPPLQTSFAQMSTSPLSRKRRSDDDDMMLDSMDQQYAYKKHLPADYHRLPPPSGSSRSFDSGAMHHLYQHAAQSHSRGAIMTFNSSPSPSSSSPGLSPTSPESMASPVDERMRIDGPAGLPAMRGPGGVYHPSSSSSSISPTTPHTYPSYAALPAFAGMGSAAAPGPGGPPASALTAMVGIEGPTAAPIRSREDEKALMQFSKRLW